MVDKEIILIREFKEETDMEVVGKLEKKCETTIQRDSSSSTSNNKGFFSAVFTNMTGDHPLCRIRFYPLHIMLVGSISIHIFKYIYTYRYTCFYVGVGSTLFLLCWCVQCIHIYKYIHIYIYIHVSM